MIKTFFYRLFIFILLVIIAFSLYKIGIAVYKYYTVRSEYNKISELATVDPDQFTGEIDWDKLKEVNPDVVGWIYLKDSNINYPIVKGDNNKKYLTTALDGTYSFAGTPFIDSRVENEFKDFNTIAYGHHMKDGSMFNNLSKYLRDDDFYTTHKQFEIITPEEKYHLQVISSFVTNDSSYVYDVDFVDEESIYTHIDNILTSNKISKLDNSSMTITPLDKLVTLSTCAYYSEESRYVVVGKLKVWTDEEKEQAKEAQKQLDRANKK